MKQKGTHVHRSDICPWESRSYRGISQSLIMSAMRPAEPSREQSLSSPEGGKQHWSIDVRAVDMSKTNHRAALHTQPPFYIYIYHLFGQEFQKTHKSLLLDSYLGIFMFKDKFSQIWSGITEKYSDQSIITRNWIMNL